MILLRMLAFRPVGADAGRVVQQQPQAQVITQKSSGAVKSKTSSTVDVRPVQKEVSSSNTAPVAAQTSQSGAVSNDWREIVNALGLGGLVKQLAVNCTVKKREGNDIVLQIAAGHSNLINPKAKQRLQQALGEYFNIEARLEVEVVNKIEAESPAQTTQREIVQRQDQAVQSVNDDSFAQSLKENFNAEVVPGYVKPVA